MTDDITLLRRAFDDATRIIDGVRPDQRELPTPCPDFTVGQLIDHLAEGHEMFVGALGGESSTDQSWASVSKRLLAAVGQPGSPDDLVELPYGEFPRSVVIQQVLGETAIHAADLARSTGQSLGDDAVYERVFSAVTDDWRVEGVLGPIVSCPDDAPLVERVLAFAGRARVI
jgi:uncharacterized protein (TIGR03086 family)